MPSTSNKGYTVPTTGSEVDTWGDDLNANLQGILDLNLGGIVTKTLGSSPVSLSATESESLIVRLNGTLTANVEVTTLCKGMTIVENVTSGAFTVKFGNGVGTAPTIPQGTKAIVITDATNGARTAADNQTEFTGGGVVFLIFPQAAAPTGWTRQTTFNDRALRIVSGSGGGSGGNQSFSTVFAIQTPAGSISNTAVTGTVPRDGWGANGQAYGSNLLGRMTTASGIVENTELLTSINAAANDNSISSPAHGHSFTGTGIDFRVQYVDAIICSKN